MLLLSALIVISIDITITCGSNVTTGTTSNVGYYNSDYITTTNSMGLIEESSPKPDDDWESGGDGGVSSSMNVTSFPYDSSFISAVFSINYCDKWEQTNHIYFQLANTFFFLSYLAPTGLYGMLYLRCTLLVGCAFFALWGWAVRCYLDAFVWNTLFVLINFIHICILLFYLRPIRFSKEVEEVYVALFRPLKVSRHKFKKVLSCMKMIRTLKYQEVYAQEKATKVDSLSLVLSGKLVVSQGGRALHIVFPHQFLDSPEWFGVSTDEFFQVSITAMEWSRVLIWHRDKLRLSIITDQFLQAVFDHILGRDVVKKLMQVSETMAASNNGHIPNMDDSDDKPMLIVKKSGDGPGITALINRQLQAGDPDAWRLGRIEEADHETPV
ncbi:blood vessel epicardial substance-like isoform X2 [Chrysoperla carnea]|uniref:blood vessel epicardial substance-like isoform X2 n=1 Tax=Chrysoperla carnea TaxID=189513 RepID=UPI001D098074|nr:blood vessel epicardial substance-like isoform X2 [Chrysoperla carnea]